jgi:hypothetical protein
VTAKWQASVVPNVRETCSDRLWLAGKQYLPLHRRDNFDIISAQYKLNFRNEQRKDLCWKSIKIFLKTQPVCYFKYISSVRTHHATGPYRTQNARSRTPLVLLKIFASKCVILCRLQNTASFRLLYHCRLLCPYVRDNFLSDHVYLV